ncbi:hypothetical protein LR392_04980 [Arthrobacter sp. AK04]|uniref:hypothetical protein n=1 Tax=Arthrobacter sp. AK04 TaxID=2900048 RepID=UPI001E3CDA81|nr:hypothetical protein [Arthrobacter sp. AK04]MCD5341581.1 hypothetical protein [Arthrobacter sp. AK04]
MDSVETAWGQDRIAPVCEPRRSFLVNGREPNCQQQEDNDNVEWMLDPTGQALSISHNRDALPDPFCGEIGRRLLLAEMQFSRWVVRRVEKVCFDEDRNVTRRLTVDFNVRDDAPLITDKVGDRFWIVPISLMRRRTLVNMRITDEIGHVLPTPGIRLTQQLDESILLAATVTVEASPAQQEVREFIRKLVAGSREETKAAVALFEGSNGEPSPCLAPLTKSPIVRAVVYLLRRNFSLYVFLPAGTKGKPERRHRLLNLEFSEPTGWRRMSPRMRHLDEGLLYTHDDRPASGARFSQASSWKLRQLGRKLGTSIPAAVGLLPTSIRLQVPGAENAASYHLELTAPAGVEVVRARLLAGRPNEDNRPYTNDRVVGHTATVGLHGVEIPNGSLCQAQIDFRVTSRGWLTNAVFSCALVGVVLLSLSLQASEHAVSWSTGQVTNIIALLITVAAAVGAMIAHSSFTGVAARMVARLRGLAAVAVAQPIVASGALAFADETDSGTSKVRLDETVLAVLWSSTYLAVAVFLLIGSALVFSLNCERRGTKLASPWDMTTDDNSDQQSPTNYRDALREYGFTGPAIGILSAEGWHERYAWTNEKQDSAVGALEGLASGAKGAPLTCNWDRPYTECSVENLCPYLKKLRHDC